MYVWYFSYDFISRIISFLQFSIFNMAFSKHTILYTTTSSYFKLLIYYFRYETINTFCQRHNTIREVLISAKVFNARHFWNFAINFFLRCRHVVRWNLDKFAWKSPELGQDSIAILMTLRFVSCFVYIFLLTTVWITNLLIKIAINFRIPTHFLHIILFIFYQWKKINKYVRYVLWRPV